MRKRSRIAIVFLLFAFSLQAHAQHRKFLMWKVTSPTATVYLVGSIHLADPSIFPLPDPVEHAFAESRVLAVEADVSNINLDEAMGLLGEYGMYGEGDSLSKHLSPETSSALDSFCEKHGLPRELLESMKPWMVALMAEATSAQQAGMDATSGIDMHFLNEIKPSQHIDQLESVQFQFKLLASASDDEQQQLLASALKSSDDIGQTEQAYLSGDVNALAGELAKVEPRSYYQRIADDRNPAMTDKVAAYLGGHETVFVVVGIAHVIGENGIARSLENKKYKVEALTYAW